MPHVLEQFLPDKTRHNQIRHDGVWESFRLKCFDCLRTVASSLHFKTLAFEKSSEEFPSVEVIIYDQNRSSGSHHVDHCKVRTWDASPEMRVSGSICYPTMVTSVVPPCARTISRTMKRPTDRAIRCLRGVISP